jgi:hypothetical protein
MLKRIPVGLGAGLLIGIVLLAGGGRVAMRLIALLAHRPALRGLLCGTAVWLGPRRIRITVAFDEGTLFRCQ